MACEERLMLGGLSASTSSSATHPSEQVMAIPRNLEEDAMGWIGLNRTHTDNFAFPSAIDVVLHGTISLNQRDVANFPLTNDLDYQSLLGSNFGLVDNP